MEATKTQILSPRTSTQRLLLVEESVGAIQRLMTIMAAQIERIELRLEQQAEERNCGPQRQPNQDLENPIARLVVDGRIQNQEGIREIINQIHPPRPRNPHQDLDSSSEEEEFLHQ